VPELWQVKGATAIRLFGPAAALDALEPPEGVSQGRVAPDEALWLADPGRGDELVSAAETALARSNGASLAVDHGDGYALFALVGDGAAEVLARVSSIRLPAEGSGFRQGQVAHLPGRVFVRPGRIDVLCTSDVAWFVRERLVHAGAGAGLVEAEPPAAHPVSEPAGVAS
jgi:hypothetical protein